MLTLKVRSDHNCKQYETEVGIRCSFQTLEKSVDGYMRFEDFLNNSHIYARGYQRDLKKSALSRALKRLREKGYIDKERFESGIIFKLTDKGRGKSLGDKIIENKEWDGKWRVIIFDIPEQNRRVRKVEINEQP